MRRLVPLAALAVFAAGAQAGADEKPTAPLPAGARKAVTDADAKVEAARKKFQAEVRAIRAKLVADLQAQLEAETKKGNLDGALAIRTEIDRLKQPDPDADAEDPDLAAARKVLVGGKWRFSVVGTPYRAEWEFRPDGTLANSDSTSKDLRWSIVPHPQGKGKALRVGATVFPLPLHPRKMSGVKTTSSEPCELIRPSDK